MTRWKTLVATLMCACLPDRLPAGPAGDIVPPPEDEGFLPPDATVTMDAGDIRVNGTPRFLTGAILLEGVDQDDGIKATGYTERFAWIYESPPDYRDAQKLGLDSFGITPEHIWRKIFRPKPIPRRNMTALNRPLKSGLPIVAELVIERGSHASMSFLDGVNPKEAAWFEGFASGIPYSIVSSEGLGLWGTIWRTSAQYFHDLEVRPFAWRLFVKADYFDTSRDAKSAFTRHLSETFKTIGALKQAIGGSFSSFSQAAQFQKSTDNTGIHVLYTQFLEDAFTKALIHATHTLGSVTGETNPAVFFQPLTFDARGINLFSAADPQRLLCAPANQEDPALTALLLRAAGGDKPLVICDVPVHGTDVDLRNTLLTQFARGYSLAFLGTWKRDARAWIRYTRRVPPEGGRPRTVLDPVATGRAGREHAQKHPDHILNPYAVPTATLGGIRMAKHDSATISDLFSASNRNAGVAIALLHARTSFRLRGTNHHLAGTNTIGACRTALADAGHALGAVAENQLSTITNTAYRVVVASDSAFAAQPDTLTHLLAFVESGGTLILTRHALTRTPYGVDVTDSPFTPADDWTRTETPGGNTREKTLGAGRVIRFATEIPPEDLHALLAHLVDAAGVEPRWSCVDAKTGEPLRGLEIAHATAPDGSHGLILFNRTGTPRTARIRLTGIDTPDAFDPVRNKPLPSDGDAFILSLQPNHAEIVTVAE